MNNKSCQLTPKVEARSKRQSSRSGKRKRERKSGKKKVQNAITVKSLAPKMLANKPEEEAEREAAAIEEDSWI